MPGGSTVTSATYLILRENLKPAIRQKRRGLLTTEVRLLHENAKPHIATASVDYWRAAIWVHWGIRWVECTPGTTTRFGRRFMRGCAPVRNNSLPAESTSFSSAGVSALNYKGDKLNNNNIICVCNKWSEKKIPVFDSNYWYFNKCLTMTSHEGYIRLLASLAKDWQSADIWHSEFVMKFLIGQMKKNLSVSHTHSSPPPYHS